MKRIASALLAGLVGAFAWALEPKPEVTDTVLPPEKATKPADLTPDDRAQYINWTRSEMELSAQLKVLDGLTEEHVKRADESARAGTPEKTKWEQDLVRELRAQHSAVLAQLNEASRQRLAFEKARGPAPSVLPGIGALEQAKPLNADEWTYLSKLDEALLNARQELATTDEAVKGLYSQLATNSTVEAVTRVSTLMDENRQVARQWERELAALELKKLEFRALRK